MKVSKIYAAAWTRKSIKPQKSEKRKTGRQTERTVQCSYHSIVMAADKNKSGRQPEKSILLLSALNQRGRIPELKETGIIVRNKLRQLADFIQEGFPEKIVEAFKYDEDQTLENQLAVTSEAIAFHQKRAGDLWLKAGKKTTPKEQYVTAQATLAAFLFAYLSGEEKEHRESTITTLKELGRQRELDIVRSLASR